MIIREETIITPLPSDSDIVEREKKWRLVLPKSYKDFVKKNNGGIPEEGGFVFNNHNYAIVRFLGIINNFKENEFGWYDISVVESQIGERLTENMDLIGVEVLPIAEIFAGDYVCLDFRDNNENPIVCIWFHEESGEFSPVLRKITDSFEAFLEMVS